MQTARVFYRTVFLVLATWFCKSGYSQTDSDLTDPNEFKDFTTFTPNAYAFSKIVNTPTSYFTGQIKPSFQLFEKKLSVLRFNMNIHFLGGGGIKVDDPGSSVGRGWSLNYGGGMIIRNIRGVPDDYFNRTAIAGYETLKTSNNGLLYNGGVADVSDGFHPKEFGPLFDYDYGIADSQHDIFEFVIPGKSGRFFIGKDKQILVVDDSKLKIIPNFTNSTVEGSEIGSFTIVDEQGIQYFFEQAETSENHRMHTEGNWRPSGAYYYKPFVSCWLLTKIEAPFGEEWIEFEYHQKTSESIISKSSYYSFTRRTNDPAGFHTTLGHGHNEDMEAAPLEIKSVLFSDGTKIQFSYFTSGAVPSYERTLIRKIEVVTNTEDVVTQFLFNYIRWNLSNEKEYINYSQTPFVPGDRANIHLEAIYTESSSGEVIPYCSFSYYLDQLHNLSQWNESLVEPKNAIDFWGFPNGKDNTGNLLLIPAFQKPAADRWPDLEHAQMGALRKIYYSTGGSEEFEYELNTKRTSGDDETVGGIRLKKRTLHDETDPSNDLVTEYKYIEPDGRSSGFLGDMPIFAYVMPTVLSDGTSWIDSVDVSHPVNPLSTIEGSSSGYRRVEEIQTKNGATNGKTVYTFTDLSFANQWSTPDYFPYTPVERPTWAIGRPDTISYYNANNQLVKRLENYYDIVEDRYLDENYRSLYVSKIQGQIFKVRKYYPLVGRTDLIETREYTYSTEIPNPIEVIKQFDYDAVYHKMNRSRTIDSRGTTFENVMHFPFEYDLGPASSLAAMVNKNMLAFPVSTETWKKTGASTSLIKANIIEHAATENGLIRPKKSYQSRIESPVVQAQSFDATILLPLNLGIDEDDAEMEFTDYDDEGRLISFVSRQAGKVSVIYDESANILAKIINASPDEVAYTTFDSDQTGQWTYNPSGIVEIETKIDNSAFTGAISKTDLLTGNYRVSLWAKGSGNISVNSMSEVISDEWKYYTWILNNVNAVSINTNGNNIDAVALRPISSQMITYQYKNGVGMISETDDNGNTKQYDYDEFNRLRFISDRHENVVKSFSYNTKKYFNGERSETYTDYFCSTGIPNGSVTYTVPAKKYTSLVSQADADLKAQWDINFNGRAYANSVGPCIPIYYNTEVNIVRQKNNCPNGYQGTNVPYVVAKEKYSSLISQSEVDAMAQADLDANAQSYANENGTCQAMIELSSLNFSGTSGYFVTFSSAANGIYDFAIPTSGGVLGQLPEGIYDVQILNPSGNGVQCSFVVGCNNGSSGTEASFSGVSISQQCSVVTIDEL